MDDEHQRPARAKKIDGSRGGIRHIQPGESPRSRRSLLRLHLMQNEGVIDFDYLGLDVGEVSRSVDMPETTPGEVYHFAVMPLSIPVCSAQISSDGVLDLFMSDGSPWLVGDYGAVRLLRKIMLTSEAPSDVDPDTLELRRTDG